MKLENYAEKSAVSHEKLASFQPLFGSFVKFSNGGSNLTNFLFRL